MVARPPGPPDPRAGHVVQALDGTVHVRVRCRRPDRQEGPGGPASGAAALPDPARAAVVPHQELVAGAVDDGRRFTVRPYQGRSRDVRMVRHLRHPHRRTRRTPSAEGDAPPGVMSHGRPDGPPPAPPNRRTC